jgi:peptidoglycan hydrolase CwlO-like protein
MKRTNKGSSFIPLLIVIVLSLIVSGSIYFLFYQEKATTTRLTGELTDMQAKNTSLQSQLDDATKKVAALKASVDEAGQKITDLTADLDKELQQKQESGTQLTQLQKDLDQEKADKAELEKKLAESQQALVTLNSRIKEMEGQMKDLEGVRATLEEKIKNYEDKKNVELGKIVVNQETTAPASADAAAAVVAAPAKSLEGKILVVNKEYNFAVINLGVKDGVTNGNIFTVYRSNKPLAELKIEKVHDSMSAAGFTADIKNKIAEGDRVELKK